jgi:hypothetical protein
MTEKIVVTFRVPGIHAWPGVVNTKYHNSQGYLQFPHRHVFHFKGVKTVSHSDRDIEIINLRNHVEAYLHERYGSDYGETGCLDFGSQSCEMLAKDLVQGFKFDSMEVLEDGENGSVVEKSEPSSKQSEVHMREPIVDIELTAIVGDSITTPDVLNGSRMSFVCSYLCSGKSTLARGIVDTMIKNNIYERGRVAHVEVSDIVKSILKKNKRSDLQGHPELQDQIKHTLTTIASRYDHIVVSGVRQIGILRQFSNASMIWLDVPEQLRQKRFKLSTKDPNKSEDAFFSANARDFDLGLTDVKEYIFFRQKLHRK